MKVLHLALVRIALPLIATACGSGRTPDLPTAATFQTQHSATTAASGPMIYVANPPSQYPGRGSILGFAADANGNVRPTLLIAGRKTTLGGDSASVAVDSLGRVYSSGTGDFANVVYIWQPRESGDVKPNAFFGAPCGDLAGSPMVLTFDRLGNLWTACTAESGGAIAEYPPIPASAKGSINPLASRLIVGVGFQALGNFASIAVNANGLVSVNIASERKMDTYGLSENPAINPIFILGGYRAQLDGNGGISYDSKGRLVACTNRNHQPRLLTFAPASDGNVAPISTLKVAGCKGIAIDPQDNVWVVFGGSITEYAAGSTGSAQPIRVISGDLTGLTNATGIAFKP